VIASGAEPWSRRPGSTDLRICDALIDYAMCWSRPTCYGCWPRASTGTSTTPSAGGVRRAAGRVLRSKNTLAPGRCGHEHNHDGTCTDQREDIDDVVERARTLATAAGRADGRTGGPRHRLAVPGDQPPPLRRRGGRRCRRETLRTLPDRLIHVARGALGLLERLDQSSDIQRWAWSPPPEVASPTRKAARHAV
jgi:hypothetical protein